MRVRQLDQPPGPSPTRAGIESAHGRRQTAVRDIIDGRTEPAVAQFQQFDRALIALHSLLPRSQMIHGIRYGKHAFLHGRIQRIPPDQFGPGHQRAIQVIGAPCRCGGGVVPERLLTT